MAVLARKRSGSKLVQNWQRCGRESLASTVILEYRRQLRENSVQCTWLTRSRYYLHPFCGHPGAKFCMRWSSVHWTVKLPPVLASKLREQKLCKTEVKLHTSQGLLNQCCLSALSNLVKQSPQFDNCKLRIASWFSCLEFFIHIFTVRLFSFVVLSNVPTCNIHSYKNVLLFISIKAPKLVDKCFYRHPAHLNRFESISILSLLLPPCD